MKKSKVFAMISKAAAVFAASLAFTITALAADGQISFSDPSATSGSEVNVTMKISADEGTKLADATVTLTYPQDKLEFVSGTDSSGGAGTIRVHGVTNGGGSSTLEYNLKFNTLAAGTSTIGIDTYEVYDEDGAAINVTHLGTSTVTVNSAEQLSQDADLATLEVSPGTLEPAFDPSVTSYTTTVGTSVELLGINALAEDPGASVMIQNNEALQLGENTVTVRVTAPDGQTVKDYVITVNKTEGGPETPVSDAQAVEQETVEGVQLSSRGKTITIMNPGDDVAIPEGFTDAIITIDGQSVKGWFWGADADPEYCVVYGMNDRGELNFYRYDLDEKTIQRYFSDPLSADAVSNVEYNELQQQYNELSSGYELRFAVICVLCVVCAALLAAVAVLSAKLRNAGRESKRNRGFERRQTEKTSERRRAADIGQDILSHDYDMEPEEYEAMDETRIISGLSADRKQADEAAEPEDEAASEEASKEASDSGRKDMTDAAAGADPEPEEKKQEGDDTFESFDI